MAFLFRNGSAAAVSARQPVATRSSRRPGAAAAEFAVVSLFFFPIVLGIIEVGRGLMVCHVLNVAAARGCRVAIIEGNAKSDVTSAVKSILDGAGITGQNTDTQVNNTSADPSTSKAGDEITVVVSIPVSNFTWLPGGKYLKGSLSGQYTLLRE